MRDANKLAEFFDKQREVIEAAETPFAKLAVFVLPILAPLVPATLTGLHIYKLLLEIFNFQYAEQVSGCLSIIVSIVLEMLGYVGAISFIQSLFRWVRTRQDEYLLPFALNGFAYIFYLLAMWLINVQLGKYFSTPAIVNNIIGLLSFVTVPTSLLAANHLSQKEEMEEEYKLRQENRADRLERYRIKHQTNDIPNETPVRRKRTNKSSKRDVRSEIESFVRSVQANEQRTPGPSEIMRELGVSKGYASETLQALLLEEES